MRYLVCLWWLAISLGVVPGGAVVYPLSTGSVLLSLALEVWLVLPLPLMSLLTQT